MRRAAPALVVIMLTPLLGGAAQPGRTPPELDAMGWRNAEWQGVRPAEFQATQSGGVRIRALGQGSFIARPLRGPPGCLAWRWRVDAGPPGTDLTQRGGDDRAIAIQVGFAGFGPQAGLAIRAQHAAAQASVGETKLPRSLLAYVWGGTGNEGEGRPSGFFPSPWAPGIGMVRVLRPAAAPRGQWMEEQVDLGADWRAAFGAGQAPPMLELIISADVEDTGARLDAQVEDIRLVPCR